MSISRILRKARAQYARSYLYTETDDNDTTYFLLYQLRVLLRAINHALKTATARYTVESHRLSHGVSYETARSDLLKLVGQQLLTQRKVGKMFVFTPAPHLHKQLSNT